jgi:hypothetical protein
MPQLHCYISESLAAKVRQRAKGAGLSASRYLAELVKLEVGTEWPEGFFEEVVGGWQGEPLERPPQAQLEVRETLQP